LILEKKEKTLYIYSVLVIILTGFKVKYLGTKRKEEVNGK